MKKFLNKIVLLFLLSVFFFSTQFSFAYEDICTIGHSVANMTVEEADNLFEDKLDGRSIVGHGKVLSVVQQGAEGTSENVTIDAECKNGVKLTLHVNTFWVKRHNVQKGSIVRFHGECVRLKKYGSEVTCIIQVTN